MQRIKSVKTGGRLVLRSYIILAFVIIGFAFVAVKILTLQTVGYAYYQKKVTDMMTTESTISSKRGDIYDSEGELLATSITTYRIFIDPLSIQDAMRKAAEKDEAPVDGKTIDVRISESLSEILGVKYDTILELTKKKGSRDATIMRYVDTKKADLVLNFISDNLFSKYVYVEAQAKRYYLYGDLASHVIGFTGTDGDGLFGLELKYNTELAGTPGVYITARDAQHKEMPYNYHSFVDAVDGYDINTTLNIKLQAILEEQLEATFTESASQAGVCGVVMNVKTGAVLAMATYPDFDINSPFTLDSFHTSLLDSSGYASGSTEYTELRSSLLQKMWRNKAVSDTYIPGSTFKIITSSMGLETGVVSIKEQFTCTGALTVAGQLIHCHKVKGHGTLTFAEGLQQSCNPILMTVGARIGAERFYDYYRNFGYLEKTGIDLPGEANGIFYDENSFGVVDLAVSSFGQNFKVSIIQHLTAVSAVANGGNLVTPYLVESVKDSDGNTVWQHETDIRRQVVSSSVCKTIAEILEGGVAGDGGAKNAYVAGYRVAAKTGTSEKIGDNSELRIGSCVAFAPADDPEIAIIIIVDEPTAGSLYGSIVAAPYIANCLEQMLPCLGVEPVYTEAEAAKLQVEVGEYRGDVVYTAKEKIEKLGLKCEIVGVGTVVSSQVPDAGGKLTLESGRIILYVGDAAPSDNIKVPNVVGMSASAANKILINAGLNIEIDGTSNYNAGSGATVIGQYPAATTAVSRGDIVRVTFRYLDSTD